MSPSATLEPDVPLDNTMGAMMIGVIVSAVLHGVCLVQAFFYFTKYKKDIWYIKALVITTVVFDAIHLCFISHTVYHYVITNYHNPDRLRILIWSVVMEALFTGVNGGIVQTFYTQRVWRLSKRNYFLTGFILCLIMATTGCGTAWVILAMQMTTYEELLKITPLTITINALSSATDVLIAVSLCIMLHNARTGFKKSDTIINRLMIFIVNTGVLTTTCAIAALIALVASSHSLIYASFYFCIGRFYTNSFLATLNARKRISSDVDETSHMMVSLPPTVLTGNMTTGSRTAQQNISIRIETTKEALRDEVNDKSMTTNTETGRSDEDLPTKNMAL
ncbi:uncharacterized protein LACBIDRAFT_316568 [Laccaria bicolor S238N-H82]|uniref:Predicted protein n=1 Tax=Laccaria bicolor (strain S238N-H82 / ATCC MYA-4686) TaxID=486041 RepID=B0E161_LACBS|nr:uncharacterized protein LACBIDRAFT_316568 [Laccaria bicolor S238N-H82]EDQ99371.1 predicted protein [Laccaria bicolor S238N-H82]|eukprot:XP_001889922.1 predicted protein [Laccaria bicolor S238N-H82]